MNIGKLVKSTQPITSFVETYPELDFELSALQH